jgi:glycosyltransferase involved in cell wall biosynthesis
MACGCPVIASVGTSLEEVCGQAAIYCDAQDDQSIRKGMVDLIESRIRREELRDLGLARASGFSWSKTVASVMSVIEDLL